MNMVRSVLSATKVAKTFWPEAVNWAVHVLNQSPTLALKDTPPEEAWSGIKPSVHYFRVFGCIVHVHVPDAKRIKLDAKSLKCIFFGTRGDDEVKLTNEELSNVEDEDLSEMDKIGENFRIKPELFNFETPLCKAFNKFNYLLKRNHSRETYVNTNGNSNYDPYLDINRIFGMNGKTSKDDDIHGKEERERDSREDTGDIVDYLISNNAPYYANGEEMQYKVERCELLRNPHQEPPACKAERFEVVKYSFRVSK
nr:retrovirus-related Pol polyprotein from transposon TNT 1-94 [Tanacetum cinerariifolium]